MKDLLLKPYLDLCVARGLDRSIRQAIADDEFLAEQLQKSYFAQHDRPQGDYTEIEPPAVDEMINGLDQAPAPEINNREAREKTAQNTPQSDPPNLGAGAIVVKQKAKPAPVASVVAPANAPFGDKSEAKRS